ncbi:hypothetical protein C8J57DRAFT_966987, partial [Mycena rebaudengoi]
KGQTVVVAINRDPEIWGPDGHQFIPALSTTIAGVWGQMLTFLGGPRAYIGFRFSLVECRCCLRLCTLEFKLAVPAADIGRLAMTIVQQPIQRNEPAAGTQMPILVK